MGINETSGMLKYTIEMKLRKLMEGLEIQKIDDAIAKLTPETFFRIGRAITLANKAAIHFINSQELAIDAHKKDMTDIINDL